MSGQRFKLYGIFKRLIDLILSAVLLIVLSPLLLIVALIIRIDSPGPAIFRQKRTGKNGKDFYIYKFRTMVKDNDVYDNRHKDKYTRIGKFLRNTSIDELPQLINILKGEMSFIGPRPWIPEYYKNMTTHQRGRYKVRPGITGLAQVSGRNRIDIFQKIEYDLEYVRRYSFLFDLKLLASTIKTIHSNSAPSFNKNTIHDEVELLKKSKNKK